MRIQKVAAIICKIIKIKEDEIFYMQSMEEEGNSCLAHQSLMAIEKLDRAKDTLLNVYCDKCPGDCDAKSHRSNLPDYIPF
jgi:hypothetical protein